MSSSEVRPHPVGQSPVPILTFLMLPRTELNLDYIMDSPWLIAPVSALHRIGIEDVLTWLTKQT